MSDLTTTLIEMLPPGARTSVKFGAKTLSEVEISTSAKEKTFETAPVADIILEERVQSPDRSLSKRRARVYPPLREMCLDYKFWPRQQLHIEELAGILSSSATPVREALARLAGEGLIDTVPNRGYAAKVLSEDEMRDNLDLLFTLLKESITRSPPERLISRMDGYPSELREDGEATFSFVNNTFTLIARLSDNEVLFEYILRLLELTRFVRRLDLEDPNAISMTRHSVLGLRANLGAGDSMSALQNLHEQNRDVQQRLAHVVKEGRARSMSQKRSSPLVRSALTPRMSTV